MKYQQAKETVLNQLSPLLWTKVTVLPTLDCLGKRLAENQFASTSLPRWPLAAMDGYAICYDHPEQRKKISTGEAVQAPLDTVIPIEHIAAEGIFSITKSYKKGQHVRPIGEVFKRSNLLANSNQILNRRDIAVLSSAGIPFLPVFESLNVGILITGDEIIPLSHVDHSSEQVQIVDTNSIYMEGFLASWDMACSSKIMVRDQEGDIEAALDQLCEISDFILVSGGTSKGDRDLVHKCLRQHETLWFESVDMKPGKPFKAGSYKKTPVFLIPGFPLAAYHVLNNFLSDVLHLSLNLKFNTCTTNYAPFKVRLSHSLSTTASIDEFLLVQWVQESTKEPMVRVLPKGSGNIVHIQSAAGFIESPFGHSGFHEGDWVVLRPLRF